MERSSHRTRTTKHDGVCSLGACRCYNDTMALIAQLELEDSNLQGLLERAAERCAGQLGADVVRILLAGADVGQSWVAAAHGVEAVALDTSFDALTRWVRAHREPGVTPAPADGTSPSETGNPCSSTLCASLRANGAVIGVIQAHCSRRDAFGAEEREHLASMADVLALAVENRRLRQDRERRVEQLRIVNEIGRDAAAILDVDQLCSRVVSLLRSRFQYYDANLFLIDAETNTLVWKSGTRLSAEMPSTTLRCPVGTGITGWVAERGQPLKVNDVSQDTQYVHVPELPDTRAELAVPIKLGESVLGVLDVQSDRTDAFDDDDVHVLQTLGNQVAIALGNAEQLEQTRQRVSELMALRQVSLQLISTTDLSIVLEAVAESALHLVGASDIHIYLYDGDADEFTYGTALWDGGLRAAVTQTVRRDGLTAQVAHGARPIVINQATDHALFQAGEAADWGVQAIAGFPLRRGDKVLGVFNIAFVRPHEFTADELRALALLADQAALAIERAQLFGQLNRRVRQLSTISRIGGIVSSSLDPDETMRVVLRHTSEAISAESGVIFLLERDVLAVKGIIGAGANAPHTLARRDENAFSWVQSTAQALLVRDTSVDPNFGPDAGLLQGSDVRTLLCVPMVIKGQVVGGIELVNRRDGQSFDEYDLELVTSVMTSAAAAVENGRLYEEMRSRLAESTALCSMAQQTTSSLAFGQVLDSIVQQLRDVISCRAISIWLIDEERQELSIAASMGIKPEFRDAIRLKVGEGVSGLVFKEVRPINIRDVRSEQPNLGMDPSVRSLLVVPLVAKSTVIGTLSVDSVQERAFTEDHERLLTIVAAQAASSIENARLFEAERQRAEELERAYEELKELDRLKSQFVQNISHELRTPLTFVKGYADLLSEEAMGPITPRQSQSLEIISRKTEAIIELVNGIITLQELESVPTHRELTSLSNVLCMVVDTARAAAISVGVELRNELPNEKLWVLADDDKLIQVFDNLIGNAIKFSPGGGTITVRVDDVDDCWRVGVHDTGIGIPEDKLERIFERFYQVDGSTTRRFGGTGLGLAIAKEIVEDNEGRIWAESVLGEGSTFFVALPKANEPSADLVNPGAS